MRIHVVSSVLLLSTAACQAAEPSDGVGVDESSVIEDATSIVRRPDGAFDVTCADGRTEVVTADQIRADDVCTPPPSGCSPDPFDACFRTAKSIDGEGLDASRANRAFLTKYGMDQRTTPEVVLGTARLHARTRTCTTEWTSPRTTTCSDWLELSEVDAISYDGSGYFTERFKLPVALVTPAVWLERVPNGWVDLRFGPREGTSSPVHGICRMVRHCNDMSWRKSDSSQRYVAFRMRGAYRVGPTDSVLTDTYFYQRHLQKRHLSGPIETSFPNDPPRVEQETELVFLSIFDR
jgi:hypothetical protein